MYCHTIIADVPVKVEGMRNALGWWLPVYIEGKEEMEV